ncbi:hypothetical protein Rctr197k_170 [Virus Rctr197k]|nr:hypothetical protein Rctr197k_170 [Virus Rctr197k]
MMGQHRHRHPFRILQAHGVPSEVIGRLELHFGPRLPAEVGDAFEVLNWAFTILPWSDVATIVDHWLKVAFRRVHIDETDGRLMRASAQLAAPDVNASGLLIDELHETLHALARARGFTVEAPLSDPRVNDEYRVWIAVDAAVFAAHATVCTLHGHDGEAVPLALRVMIKALIMQDDTFDTTIDRMVCELFQAVDRFVGSWVPGAREKN